MSKWHILKCRRCKGEGVVKVGEFFTPKDKDSLAGVVDKMEVCQICRGIGYVRVDVEDLNEVA